MPDSAPTSEVASRRTVRKQARQEAKAGRKRRRTLRRLPWPAEVVMAYDRGIRTVWTPPGGPVQIRATEDGPWSPLAVVDIRRSFWHRSTVEVLAGDGQQFRFLALLHCEAGPADAGFGSPTSWRGGLDNSAGSSDLEAVFFVLEILVIIVFAVRKFWRAARRPLAARRLARALDPVRP